MRRSRRGNLSRGKPLHCNSYFDMLLDKRGITVKLSTVNVEIFAQYIFSRILRSVLGARKYDVSEKMNQYSANKSNC